MTKQFDTRKLWALPPEQFNNWRRKNDYPVILDLFKKKLPNFTDWMKIQNISENIIFEKGIARFVSTEKPFLLCKYKTDKKYTLFEKTSSKLSSIKKSGLIEEEHEYYPYFYWLKKNHGKKVFEETKRYFIISSWVGGKPQFLKEHFLLNLGDTEINAPILSGRLLDFTCLDDLKITGAINNTSIHLWYCSAIGLKISGGLAFLDFYKTILLDHGYGIPKRELTLNDGVFQDLYFKDCKLGFHASRSTLLLCSVSGIKFEATLEHTNIEKSKFVAHPPMKHNYLQKNEFYNKVKILYSSIGQKSEAGDYLFKEKINHMLSLLTPHKTFRESWFRKNLFKKILFTIKCYIKFIINFMNYIVWGFGERPFRSLITSIFVIFLSASVFYSNSCSATYNDLVKSLYFSMVTFVTLGYGDISQKESFLRIFSSIEAFSGMVLMGLFLAGYASKSKEY